MIVTNHTRLIGIGYTFFFPSPDHHESASPSFTLVARSGTQGKPGRPARCSQKVVGHTLCLKKYKTCTLRAFTASLICAQCMRLTSSRLLTGMVHDATDEPFETQQSRFLSMFTQSKAVLPRRLVTRLKLSSQTRSQPVRAVHALDSIRETVVKLVL